MYKKIKLLNQLIFFILSFMLYVNKFESFIPKQAEFGKIFGKIFFFFILGG